MTKLSDVIRANHEIIADAITAGQWNQLLLMLQDAIESHEHSASGGSGTGSGDAAALDISSVVGSGVLSPEYGGTGVDNGTNELTIPATGTAALLEAQNVFTVDQFVGTDAQVRTLWINGPAGTTRQVGFRTAGANRWLFRVTSSAETGDNAGSDFVIHRRTDAGGILGDTLLIKRDTGHVLVNTATDSAQLAVQADAAGTVGLVVNTAASPTANLAEFRNNGTAVFTINEEGQVTSRHGTAEAVLRLQTDQTSGHASVLLLARSGTNVFKQVRLKSAGGSGTDGNFVLEHSDVGGSFTESLRVLGSNKHLLLNTTTDSAQLTVQANAAGTIGLVVNTAASPTEPAFVLRENGSTSVEFLGNNGSYNDGTVFDAAPLDRGTAIGRDIILDRNSNAATPAAGVILIVNLNSTIYRIWPDASGNLRIWNNNPTNANDTSGTVVGSQSSRLETKELLGDGVDPETALATILETPIRRFRYKNGSYNGSEFHGVIADWSPAFAMDDGRVFSPVSAFGYTVQAIKALYKMISDMQGEV